MSREERMRSGGSVADYAPILVLTILLAVAVGLFCHTYYNGDLRAVLDKFWIGNDNSVEEQPNVAAEIEATPTEVEKINATTKGYPDVGKSEKELRDDLVTKILAADPGKEFLRYKIYLLLSPFNLEDIVNIDPQKTLAELTAESAKREVEVLEERLDQPPYRIKALVRGLFLIRSEHQSFVLGEMEKEYPDYRPRGHTRSSQSGDCQCYRLIPNGDGGWKRHCMNDLIEFKVRKLNVVRVYVRGKVRLDRSEF